MSAGPLPPQDHPARPWLSEENEPLLPLLCPACRRFVASSASCHIAVETPAGSLLVSTGYARFLCLCGAIAETRRSERTGRLYLALPRSRRPHQRFGTSPGRGSRPR